MTFIIYRQGRKYIIENAVLDGNAAGLSRQEDTFSTLTDHDLHRLSLTSLLPVMEDGRRCVEEGKVNPRIGIFCDMTNIN